MTALDFAAWLGAAAWLPQVATWIYGSLAKSKVSIVPHNQMEIGFTTLGPLLNVHMAFSAEQKDALVGGLEVTICHSTGETHSFIWYGMKETLGEVSDLAGNRQYIEKEQRAIALRIAKDTLVEKFVRFQEHDFRAGLPRLTSALAAHVNYLKASSADYRADVLRSRQHHDVVTFFRQAFFWKAGRYSLTFDVYSRGNTILEHDSVAFDLSQEDVDALNANVNQVPIDLENSLNIGNTAYQQKVVNWNWRTVTLLAT